MVIETRDPRQTQKHVEAIKATIMNEVENAKERVNNVRRELGHALLRARLGTAGEGEVAGARNAVAVAEEAHSDLVTMMDALPTLVVEGLEAIRSEEARLTQARQKEAEQHYRAQREAFEENYKNLARDSVRFKQAADALFDAARVARMVNDLRQYFRSIQGRDKANWLQRY